MAMLLKQIVFPLLTSILIIAVAFRIPGTVPRRLGIALGAGLGLLISAAAIVGVPSLPPIDSSHWLMLLAPVIPLLFWLEQKLPHPLMRLAFATATSAGALMLLLKPIIEYQWEATLTAAGWIIGLTLAATGFRFGLQRSVRVVNNRWTQLFLWAGVVLVAAILIALSGSMSLAQQAGAFNVAMLPLLLVLKLSKDQDLFDYLTPVVAYVLTALAVIGHFYSELSVGSVILLAAAALIPQLLVGRVASSKLQPVFAAAGVILPAAVALALAASSL